MCMDDKAAVKSYQFAERSKSELLILSRLLISVVSYPEKEKGGGKRMLLDMMDAVRAEMEFAHRATEHPEFQKSIAYLSDAISLTESNQFGIAAEKMAQSVSAATTVAQEAWQVLSEHGLL